jgi:hypothetical protein
MQPTVHARATILRRLGQIELELRHVRAELKNLRKNDPETSEVVLRGARLSQERSGLERRLEVLQVDSRQMADLRQTAGAESGTEQPA